MERTTYLWKDRKRIFGLPITFTKYSVSENRIFREKGLLNQDEEEVLLYRVRDLDLRRSLVQRIFGVGTVCIHSSDQTTPILELQNVKQPKEVKELIFRQVEQAKDQRRMRTTELLGDSQEEFGHGEWSDGAEQDGIDLE